MLHAHAAHDVAQRNAFHQRPVMIQSVHQSRDKRIPCPGRVYGRAVQLHGRHTHHARVRVHQTAIAPQLHDGMGKVRLQRVQRVLGFFLAGDLRGLLLVGSIIVRDMQVIGISA